MSQKKLDLGRSGGDEEGPVECLGMTFENDEARREYFLEKLGEKLQDPEFRKIPGFPKGDNGDILRLSDPPYYTACPNPFFQDYISHFEELNGSAVSTDEPFAADTRGSRHNAIYKAHTYHTKVPWEAIREYLLHFLPNGGIVLDSFAGSGMTGAAALCSEGEEDPDYATLLNDFSPAATFIAANTLHPISASGFAQAAESALRKLRRVAGSAWMAPVSPGSEELREVAYFVWSVIVTCPNCGQQHSIWDLGYQDRKIQSELTCSSCLTRDKRAKFERVHESYFDSVMSETRRRIKRRPVYVSFTGPGRPSRALSKAESEAFMPEFSGLPIPEASGRRILDKTGVWGVLYRSGYHFGIEYFHDLFSPRSLESIGWIWQHTDSMNPPVAGFMRYWITSCLNKLSLLMAYNPDGIGRVMKGNLYIGAVTQEMNPVHLLQIGARDLKALCEQMPHKKSGGLIALSTGSAEALTLRDETVDYAIVDPPFGGVVPFAELNFIWEAILGVGSDHSQEITVNAVREISEDDFESRITASFKEIWRVLKPNRWITVIFHNSSNRVWNRIQTAIGMSGFVVADVRILDRKQGAIKQVTTAGAVKKDLVISAYKPTRDLIGPLTLAESSEAQLWQFVREHLRHLPVFLQSPNGGAEVITERQAHMLFDRSVAFHVQRGIALPLSASEFYAGLRTRFPERDKMFFLSDQAATYDKRRAKATKLEQLSLFITDEATAIQWIRQELLTRPRSFQDLQPAFMQEVQGWAKHEITVELKEMLDQNFLCYDGTGATPSQIHSYLSTNFKDLRKLEKDDPKLKAKAKDRWYVPSPERQGDLEKLRERGLLKVFGDYRVSTKKKIKRNLRTEAVRAGFKAAYDADDYQTIIDVAKKVPDNVLQEDEKLLMYYDVALTRLGED